MGTYRISLTLMPGAFALAGCAAFAVDGNRCAVNEARPRGSEFTEDLTRDYKQFASWRAWRRVQASAGPA